MSVKRVVTYLKWRILRSFVNSTYSALLGLGVAGAFYAGMCYLAVPAASFAVTVLGSAVVGLLVFMLVWNTANILWDMHSVYWQKGFFDIDKYISYTSGNEPKVREDTNGIIDGEIHYKDEIRVYSEGKKKTYLLKTDKERGDYQSRYVISGPLQDRKKSKSLTES